MKKLFLLLVCLCLLVTVGCRNRKNTAETTSPDSKFDEFDITERIINVFTVTIDELKIIRNAVNTIPEDKFQLYMFRNHESVFNNGMNNLENAKALMEEFEATTIPVLDGDINNISTLSFDCDYNHFYQLIVYDNEMTQRIGAWIYTANYTVPKKNELTKNIKLFSIKNIKNDKYTAKLYETRNADDKFIAEITTDGSYIVLRSGGIEEMEEFEECFSRLEFRKIGDLLNEIPEETTENALSENEQTAVTENVYVVETTLPEPTQKVTVE